MQKVEGSSPFSRSPGGPCSGCGPKPASREVAAASRAQRRGTALDCRPAASRYLADGSIMELQTANPSAAHGRRTVEGSTGAAPLAAQPARSVGQLDRTAVVRLQRSVGNRATTRVLQRSNGGTRYA